MELQSIWTRNCELRERPALDKDIKTEAAVIGGGMAGILTAWELESAGVRTVVLEAERIGSGQTGNTTAKITSQHGMFCSEFLERKGKETAEKYVRANEEAVREYKRIVKEKRIECDLEQTDSYFSIREAGKSPAGQLRTASQRIGSRLSGSILRRSQAGMWLPGSRSGG